ncbi:hypothetical protein [Mucilaginibacter sp. FT3.2]|uniref:hypothetical protein n=1 Tax=Mucilaginibacter sp. FT3.2 TaxID=2723090 RepID=UPI001610CF2A|nr:hypothetical protein [Mucilaginibacter sp. FT3.2]MBB6231718.1 hypothetical protein [Mucilaginibacter sp. FT3.2]
MSQDKTYLLLCKSLREAELYAVAKLYLKEVESIENIIVTNGPWDSGLDMMSATKPEAQYQATVEEKGFERKLYSDLEKAKNNVQNHGLPSRVKYFYSHPISITSIHKFKREAKEKYNIILDIIEATHISQIAQEYRVIGKLLFDISKLSDINVNNDYFDNVKVKAYYDLMSFGKTTDIKFNIIKSFVLNYLFNNLTVTKDELLEETNNHFKSNLELSYFDYFLGKLSTEKRVILNKGFPSLSQTERDRITIVLQNYQVEEALLLSDISNALRPYGLENNTEEIVIQLSELYESSYSINLSEFTRKDTNLNDVKAVTNKLKNLLSSLTENDPAVDLDKLTIQLTKISDSSDILPRIAAGQVYSKVSDPDRLQDYIKQNINNKTIFLDANVMLNLLLAHYEDAPEYNNYFYKVANQFLKFSKANGLILKTIRVYAIETTRIFKDAVSLIPITKSKLFHALGTSSNPLYRFYQHLHDYNLLRRDGMSFEEFMADFKFTIRSRIDDNYKSQMEYLLDSLNVEIEDFPPYELGITIEIINSELRSSQRVKSNFAISNDAIMFRRLGDRDSELNPVDPIFCTWDLSLLRVRTRYFEQFSNCTKWFMFTPARLMDHFSMMNFQIKPGMVSSEVLSILDNAEGMQQMTHTLLDSIMVLINTQNVTGLKYTNMLAEMREKDILQVNSIQESVVDTSNEVLPTDIIFRHLFDTYIIHKEERQSAEFKILLTRDQYFNEMSEILLTEKKYVLDYGKVSEDLITKIDNVIEKSKQQFI